ncbi:Predicted arabinose efflux permease, MFS family [Pseudomonas sp. NFR16]|nr:Predicted arabinose efflux permease, MFS family [Pseudomonas sp. NFR16]
MVADTGTAERIEQDLPRLSNNGTVPAWRAVAALALSTFTCVTTEFLPVGLLTNIASSLHVSEGAAGLMITTPGLMAAASGPLLIILAGRLDRRIVLLLLATLLVLSNVIAAMAPNLATILVARMLLGLCVGGFWTFAPSATGRLVPEALQPRAMSYIMAGISVATIAGVPAGALLGEIAGWRMTFFAITGLALIVLILQILTLPPMPAERAIKIRELKAPFAKPPARAGLIVTLLLVSGHFATYSYLKPMFQQLYGVSPEGVTTVLLIYGVAGFIGTFMGGRLVTKSVRGTALAAVLMIAAVLTVSAVGVSGLIAGSVSAGVWGAAFGLVPVSLTTWMLNAMPDSPEAGQAVQVSVFQIGISLGAFVGGLVLDAYSIVGVLALGSTLLILAAVAIGAARSEPRHP